LKITCLFGPLLTNIYHDQQPLVCGSQLHHYEEALGNTEISLGFNKLEKIDFKGVD
jgi:hypothetical protein